MYEMSRQKCERTWLTAQQHLAHLRIGTSSSKDVMLNPFLRVAPSCLTKSPDTRLPCSNCTWFLQHQ